MKLREVVECIRASAGCTVYDSVGLPKVGNNLVLPDDVKEFYTMCGGMRLFEDSGMPISIVQPDDFVPADPVILVGLNENELDYREGHTSWSWYIIADGGSGEYVTIDLSPERLGRCYDSVWYYHPGNSTIIAKSFAEFLERLYTGGDAWYWHEPTFESYGPAYTQ